MHAYIGLEGPLAAFVFGLTLHLAVRLVQGDPYSIPSEAVMAWLLWASRVLLVAALLGAAAALQGGAVHVGFWFVLGLVFAVGIVRRRSSHQTMLLRVLAMAAEHRLPLPATASALARDGHGFWHRRLGQFAELLSQGASLPDVVAQPRFQTLFPAGMAVASRVGQDIGRLGPALRELATASQAEYELVRNRRVYVVGMLFTCSLLSYFVIRNARILEFTVDELSPQRSQILSLVALTQNDLFKAVALGLILLLALFWFVLTVPRVVSTVFRSFGFLERHLNRWTPAARRQLSPHGPATLNLLAHAVDSKAPLSPIVESMAICSPNLSTRRRLARAFRALEDGGDLPAALIRAQLATKTEGGLLAAAQRVGNLAWALRRIAAARHGRWLARERWLDQVLFPCLMLIPVAAVAALAYGMLWALVSAIEQMV